MSRIRQTFRDLDAEVPNTGSWARRLATALDPEFSDADRGSWARRVIMALNTDENLGTGSWKSRLETAIRKELVGNLGAPPLPDPVDDEVIVDPGEDYDIDDPVTWDPPGEPVPEQPPQSAPVVLPPSAPATLPNGNQRRGVPWTRPADAGATDAEIDSVVFSMGRAQEVLIDVALEQPRVVRFRGRNSKGVGPWSDPVVVTYYVVPDPELLDWRSGYLTGGSADSAVIEFDDVQEGDLIVVATSQRNGPYVPDGFTAAAGRTSSALYDATLSYRVEGANPTGVYTIQGVSSHRGYLITHARGVKLHTLNRMRGGENWSASPMTRPAVTDVAAGTPTWGFALAKAYGTSSPSINHWPTIPEAYSFLAIGGPGPFSSFHTASAVHGLDGTAAPGEIQFSLGGTNNALVQALMVPLAHVGPRDTLVVGTTRFSLSGWAASGQMLLHSNAKVGDDVVVVHSHGRNDNGLSNVVGATKIGDTIRVDGDHFSGVDAATVTVWKKTLTADDIANGITVEGRNGATSADQAGRDKHFYATVFDGTVEAAVQDQLLTTQSDTVFDGPTITSPPDNAAMLTLFKASHFGKGQHWTFDEYYDTLHRVYTGGSWWRWSYMTIKHNIGTGGVPVTVNGSASLITASGSEPKAITVLVTPLALGGLDDVNVAGSVDGAELMFDETAGEWQPSETT